ncbi:MAG: insulinase family protein [Clostridia bacterium]|nr:insulinase family protein [Clostridia bacterium]
MNRSLESYKINARMNLYVIQTKKFKTDLIGVYIKQPLNKHEASLNALLTRILMRGTVKYPSAKALNIQLESSYGMIMVSDVVKYGEHHILQFKLQFPNGKHLLENHIFNDALELVEEVIFHPLMEKDHFIEDYFQQEKDNLVDEIESRINDKMSYALERCIECMYDNRPYSEYVYGNVDRVKAITVDELTKHYHHILETAQFDICVMGDLNPDEVKASIQRLPVSHVESSDYHMMCDYNHVSEIRYFSESLNIKQGKLVLGYKTQICQNDPLYEASVLAYHIFGGGPNSRLFHELREEKGLCYYVFAKSDRFKGCMFIGAGIEDEHQVIVETSIHDSLQRLKEEGITKKELQMAVDEMFSSIASLSDFPNSFINFYYTELLGRPLDHYDIDDMLYKYQSITLDDIKAVYQKLELDTVYMLKGE